MTVTLVMNVVVVTVVMAMMFVLMPAVIVAAAETVRQNVQENVAKHASRCKAEQKRLQPARLKRGRDIRDSNPAEVRVYHSALYAAEYRKLPELLM